MATDKTPEVTVKKIKGHALISDDLALCQNQIAAVYQGFAAVNEEPAVLAG